MFISVNTTNTVKNRMGIVVVRNKWRLILGQLELRYVHDNPVISYIIRKFKNSLTFVNALQLCYLLQQQQVVGQRKNDILNFGGQNIVFC
jgi:hypothetical protein